MSATGLAIVAGSGELPKAIAEHCRRSGRPCCVVEIGAATFEWAAGHPRIAARIEMAGQLVADLHRAGCGEVVFAGGMLRPKLDPAIFDTLGRAMAASFAAGDDATLRAIAAVFETAGLPVVGAQDVLPGLLVTSGIHGRVSASADDRADAARAAQIVAALGAVDVGQAAVVAQGICLGVESVQGTDALLGFVAGTADRVRLGTGGVLFKAAKPGQDRRFDLPSIGAQTIRGAAAAGLNGVAVQAGDVLAVDLAEIVALADELGLFLWGREGR